MRVEKQREKQARKGRSLLRGILQPVTTLALAAGLMLGVGMTAKAANVPVESSTTTWTDGNTYVVSSDVEIQSRVTVTGNVTLQLNTGKKLTVPQGITVSSGNTLTIKGSGTLVVDNPNMSKAGIGGDGNSDKNCGTIIINGGTLDITGGTNAAGIGGGRAGTGGNITINDGTITVNGGGYGSGIGGGNSGNCGNITINGGTITVNGSDSGGATAIGNGPGANGGKIIINGGTVNAISKANGGAAIGGADSAGVVEISITGGEVNATTTSGYVCAIGGGNNGTGGKITISGGKVTATTNDGCRGAAAIGGSRNCSGGEIIITGGEVTAKGCINHYGIGGGDEQTDQGTLKIGSGMVAYASDTEIADVSSVPDNMKTTGPVDNVTVRARYMKVVAGSSSGGDTEIDIEQDDNAPETRMENPSDAIIDSLLTNTEKALVAGGKNLRLWLEITNIDGSVSETEKNISESAAKKVSENAVVGMYFDLSFYKKIGDSAPVKIEKIPGGKIKLTFKIPDKLKASGGKKRDYFVIKVHGSLGVVIGQGTGEEIAAETDEFSTYALAYADENAEAIGFNTSIKIKQSKGKIKISWDKVEGVSKVELFFTYCGKKYPSKATKKSSGKSVSIKKLKGSAIDFTKDFKFYLVAYDSNGKKLGKTPKIHFAGKDNPTYTNPKSLKISKDNVSIAKGQSTRVTGKIKLEKSSKKQLPSSHAAKLRYVSTNKGIATVDKKGNITGVNSGTCEVYVYCLNGIAKKVAVTVN